ncbi:hypothetical protein [Streptomyces sp. NPDC051993]|uniref:hypothetical protein n=1 Tax=Streptomyces sp. NPDC051993 TaxID=3155286 RepID=UPI00342F7D35
MADSDPSLAAGASLRQDQCLMADVLRLGGPAMAQTALNGLNQPADKLHALADRQFWQKTPLAAAYQQDRDTADQELNAISAVENDWASRVGGFGSPPGTHDIGDGKSFYNQTGLTKWIADRWWKNDYDFYNDPTPRMDAQTRQAVEALGAPRYTLFSSEGDGNSAERQDFHWKMQSTPSDHAVDAGADDARIFLASGGLSAYGPAAGHARVPDRGRGSEVPVRVLWMAEPGGPEQGAGWHHRHSRDGVAAGDRRAGAAA